MNTIIIVGNLGKDPEQSTTQDGTPITRFTVADNMVKKQGETAGKTQWFNVTAWRGLATQCAKYLKKGSHVYVQGVLEERRFTRKDGTEGTSLEVTAERVQFLDARSTDASTTSAAPDADIPF